MESKLSWKLYESLKLMPRLSNQAKKGRPQVHCLSKESNLLTRIRFKFQLLVLEIPQ